MSDPRLAPGMAMRNPRRGKAHRGVKSPWARDWDPHPLDVETFCGQLPDAMTEAVPVAQTALKDRCRRCWKETP